MPCVLCKNKMTNELIRVRVVSCHNLTYYGKSLKKKEIKNKKKKIGKITWGLSGAPISIEAK